MGVRSWTYRVVALAAAGGLAAGCAGTGGPRRAAAPTASRCGDERFPIYFAPRSAELRTESRDVIRTVANRVAGCRVTVVEVTGVSVPDRSGAASDPALTQHRADAVAQALAGAGLPSPAFDVQVAGAPAPPSGARTPLARRTEVVVHTRPAG